MQGDEEDQTTGKNITAVNINGEGTPRKKARKARKQVQREQQGNKQEREAKKTAPSATTGETVSSDFSSPIGMRKTSTKFSQRQITFKDHKIYYEDQSPFDGGTEG